MLLTNVLKRVMRRPAITATTAAMTADYMLRQ
jgi:hypothetical protein